MQLFFHIFATNFPLTVNLRAGGLYRGTSRKGTTVFVSLQPGTQSWPQALAREVKLLLVPFKDPEKAAGAAGELVAAWPMPHRPAKCCGLPFGEPSCCKAGLQGQPRAPAVRAAKLLETAPSLFGFRLSRSGLCCCIWQNRSEFINASKAHMQPSPTFCPNAGGENKLHRGRAGLHPKPMETSGETKNDFSSSHSLSLSISLELKLFACRKQQTNPNTAAAASEPCGSLTQANPLLFSFPSS